MLARFFMLAAVSPGRQLAFRRAVVGHLLVLVGGLWVVHDWDPSRAATMLGHLLLVMGIVEGAVLLGWRLTQLPKSQALEFLLVTPVRPGHAFLAEAAVGLTRLAFVTLAGLPILLILVVAGRLDALDLVPLLVMPWTWGAVTGLGLSVWVYEAAGVRRWVERIGLGLVVVYLAIGVAAGEHLRKWIAVLPDELGQLVLFGFYAFHGYNPFGTMQHWMEQDCALGVERMAGVELTALVVVALLLVRASRRMAGHFHDLHYSPVRDERRGRRPPVGDRPLSWWAVKRVTQFSGRVNLWLAGGFGVLYALYTVAGDNWPAWMGRSIFQIFLAYGGISVLATALVILAAVPASFQYGLWDSNSQDRCRRLELLLLTQLNARDYWDAAAAAAWRRGRGYFAIAGLLWIAALVASQVEAEQALAALAAGVLLWALYFAVGFRAFSRGLQANGLGMALTLGLPLLTVLCWRAGWPGWGALLPPGGVYAPIAGSSPAAWLAGALLAGVVALAISQVALRSCDRELRAWYDRHQGRKVID
jgi:hypothetical protein